MGTEKNVLASPISWRPSRTAAVAPMKISIIIRRLKECTTEPTTTTSSVRSSTSKTTSSIVFLNYLESKEVFLKSKSLQLCCCCCRWWWWCCYCCCWLPTASREPANLWHHAQPMLMPMAWKNFWNHFFFYCCCCSCQLDC